MCREPCTKLGMTWEERILQLHWMVHVVVHIQQFINTRNVRDKLYGPWGHFLKEMFGMKSCTVAGPGPYSGPVISGMFRNI